MNLKVVTGLVLTLFLANMLTLAFNPAVEGAVSHTTTVYVYPATITATEVNQTFTVDIWVANVTDLEAAQAGLTFDPNGLECLNFSLGPFITSGGAFGEWYLGVSGTINNTAGEIYPPYAIALIWDYTVSGSGVLFTATFKAKKTGTFNVHPSEITLLREPTHERIPVNVIDVFAVIWEGDTYPAVTVSNLTWLYKRYRLSDHAFNQPTKEISFNVTGSDGATVFLNVTIPKKLLSSNATHPWLVFLDGISITYTKVENATHTSLYFTCTLSNHHIQIIGTWVVAPEFPTWTSILLILIVLTVATAIYKRRLLKTPIH